MWNERKRLIYIFLFNARKLKKHITSHCTATGKVLVYPTTFSMKYINLTQSQNSPPNSGGYFNKKINNFSVLWIRSTEMTHL